MSFQEYHPHLRSPGTGGCFPRPENGSVAGDAGITNERKEKESENGEINCRREGGRGPEGILRH